MTRTPIANRFRHIGRNMPNLDGVAKTTGRAAFVADRPFAGLLQGKILRSPHAHARIRHVEIARAAALPGVVAIVTSADLAGLEPCYGLFIKDQPVLAQDKVRYVGDPVAAVAAIDEATALRALQLIDVAYEPLPAVMTLDDALSPDAPLLFDTPQPGVLPPDGPNARAAKEPRPNVLYDYDYALGDLAAAFAGCDHVFEDRFTFARLSHYTLEPHATVARVQDGRIELWSNNQDPFLLRADIAAIFKLPPERVRVETAFIGGGFGAKSYCKAEPIAVLLARKAGAPVSLTLAMDESMSSLCEHAAVMVLKTGVRRDGTLVARQTTVQLDGGAYADASPAVAEKLGQRMPGAYRWQAIQAHVEVIRTNTVPAGSFRGFGNAHTCWASESQIDMIAQRLGLDPIALRRRNFIPPGEPFLPGDSAVDVDLAAGLDAVLDVLGRHLPVRLGRGVGLAVALKGAGGQGHRAGASVTIRRDGTVALASGIAEIGQGSRMIHAQLVAEILNLPMASITVVPIDTATSPYDTGTHASAGLAVAGIAIRQAAMAARDQLLALAAAQLGCDAGGLTLEDHVVRQGGAPHDWRALLQAADRDIRGEGEFQVGNKTHYWMPCWCAAEVEVDRETGRIALQRLIIAVDAGIAIHPRQCHAQILGAAVQGIGQALYEAARYDGEKPANLTPLGYRVPLAGELPPLETILLEFGQGPGPFGAKGIGEAANLPVPAAIANAVADALGVRITDLPLTPERVLAALNRKHAVPGAPISSSPRSREG